MEEKQAIYDKVRISIKALSIFIVLGLFMTALVTAYGYYMGNPGGGALPALAHKEQESEEGTEAVEEQKNIKQNEASPIEYFENASE